MYHAEKQSSIASPLWQRSSGPAAACRRPPARASRRREARLATPWPGVCQGRQAGRHQTRVPAGQWVRRREKGLYFSYTQVLRVVTRAHLIAWRKDLEGRGCEGSTIRCKLSVVSSLFEYLCERNTVVHNPVQGVKRPKVTNANEGLTPALSEEQARLLLEAPPADTLKGKRDRAILATLLYHGVFRPSPQKGIA